MLSSIKDIPDNKKNLRVNNVYFCRTEVVKYSSLCEYSRYKVTGNLIPSIHKVIKYQGSHLGLRAKKDCW